MNLIISSNSDPESLVHRIHAFAHQSCDNLMLATEVTTIGSELLYNIIKYGKRGSISLSVSGNSITIEASDLGPGFAADLENALEDGFSSSDSLGLGLPSIFRLSNHVELETSEHGTRVFCEVSMS